MFRPTARLAAGALVLALPLAAAAGCGVQKKRTIKAEFSSASSHLQASKALSFSLSLRDAKGALKASAKKDDASNVSDIVLGGKVTVTIDPTGAKSLADLSAKTDCSAAKKPTPADISASLKKVNLSIVVSDATSALGELRLVDGALFAHADLKEIGVVAGKAGVKDFDSQVDDAVSSADPKFAQALTDARAGKWLTLDVAKYADKFADLAKSFTSQFGEPSATSAPKLCADAKGLSKDLFGAVKPYVKVTDANDSSADRVLDVNVKVRPALKAALSVLKAAKGLPFASLLSSIEPTDIDDNVADGTAHGTITLKSGHLTQFAVDIESLRTLNPDAGKTSLAGSFVVLDVDDAAAPVTAPTDVSSFDVGALIDTFLQGFSGAGSSTGLGLGTVQG